MNDIVTMDAKTGEMLLDSRVAARELGIEHESLLRLFVEHQELGIEYSDLKSEKTGKRGQPAKYVLLNERQALLLITMVKNTDSSLQKKQKFVDAFLSMRNTINELRVSKAVRRELTDSIRDSALNEKMHGFAYKTITDLIYKVVLGMDSKHFREAMGLEKDASVKASLTGIQLTAIERLEKLTGSMIELGAEYDRIKDAVLAFSVPRLPCISAQARDMAATIGGQG